MQRILLIKASNDFPAVTFPLGLMYLSAALKKEYPGCEVEVFDLRLKRNDQGLLDEEIRRFRPTLVGISFLSVELDSAIESARQVRAYDRSVPIIAGGPHPSSDPEGLLREFPELDYAAVGEGEETFVEWFKSVLEDSPDLSGIAGLWWRNTSGAVIANQPRASIQDIEGIPAPDYDLIQPNDYWNEWSMGHTKFQKFHRYANLFTSRACPYRCTYCHDLFGKGFRARSPAHVVAEMEFLQKKFGVEEFEILDDIFNFDVKRTKNICRLMMERGITARLSFPNGLRTDRLDKEVIRLLKESGTRFIAIAVETVTPRLQKQTKKNLRVEYVFEMIEECYRRGIFTRGYFMIGFPSETREEIEATIDYACRSKLNSANFFIVVPYKGTAIEKENLEFVESMNINYGRINYWTNDYNMSNVSNRELKQLQRKAILRFYLAPKRIYYALKRISLWKLFLNGFVALLNIFWELLSVDFPNYYKIWFRFRKRFHRRKGLEITA